MFEAFDRLVPERLIRSRSFSQFSLCKILAHRKFIATYVPLSSSQLTGAWLARYMISRANISPLTQHCKYPARIHLSASTATIYCLRRATDTGSSGSPFTEQRWGFSALGVCMVQAYFEVGTTRASLCALIAVAEYPGHSNPPYPCMSLPIVRYWKRTLQNPPRSFARGTKVMLPWTPAPRGADVFFSSSGSLTAQPQGRKKNRCRVR